MSSTPASSSDAASSTRVQSASNKAKQESSTDHNHATTTAKPSVRPSSAAKQPVTAEGRPGSAAKVPSQDITNRPASAAKVDGTASNASAGSRPPSAAKKADETVSNDANVAAPNRPPSAAKKPEASCSRPPSASSAGGPTAGSRPPSAVKNSVNPAGNYTILGDNATLPAVDPNDPNITQPIIGPPSTTAKNVTGGEVASNTVILNAGPANPSDKTASLDSATTKP